MSDLEYLRDQLDDALAAKEQATAGYHHLSVRVIELDRALRIAHGALLRAHPPVDRVRGVEGQCAWCVAIAEAARALVLSVDEVECRELHRAAAAPSSRGG